MTSDLTPAPAATVAVVRDQREQEGIEVLLLRRHEELVFMGGHWVFPGGRLDREDYAEDKLEYPAARRAAVRETREEAGLELDPERLIHTAHWTTPPRQVRRFSTWFFVYPLTDEVNVRVDQLEITAHRWLSPQAALRAMAERQLPLSYPTRATLEDISAHASLRELQTALRQAEIRVEPEHSSFYRPDEMGCA